MIGHFTHDDQNKNSKQNIGKPNWQDKQEKNMTMLGLAQKCRIGLPFEN